MDVFLSADAERDIVAIHRYLTSKTSLRQADGTLDALERACAMLADFPMRGNVPPELREIGVDVYREVHHRPYRVIYRLLPERVVVYAVLDARRDLQTLLEQRLLR